MISYPPDFPTPEMVSVNGVDLEVVSVGEGRPILLCHGWPEIAYSWRHQIPMLAEMGYHVIAPNQRGYAGSSKPDAVTDYDMEHLTGDLAALLDHYGHKEALYIGHDWGALVVWGSAMMRPERVSGIINLSVPYPERGSTPWIDFWEAMLGPDFYIVHFNRQPGVADAVFEANPRQFLGNMYSDNLSLEPEPGMALINLAKRPIDHDRLVVPEADLDVYAAAFEQSGFTGGINWYRNFNRNWHAMSEIEERIDVPTLMIYGAKDAVPQKENLADFVPNVETHVLDCGHWIQQEKPDETNALMRDWLTRHYPT